MMRTNINKGKAASWIAVIIALVLTMLFPYVISVSDASRKVKVGNAYYTVVSDENATVEYINPISKTCTSATIPKTVKIGKKTYKVTGIAENAFKGCSKLKTVTIGKNVGKKEEEE